VASNPFPNNILILSFDIVVHNAQENTVPAAVSNQADIFSINIVSLVISLLAMTTSFVIFGVFFWIKRREKKVSISTNETGNNLVLNLKDDQGLRLR